MKGEETISDVSKSKTKEKKARPAEKVPPSELLTHPDNNVVYANCPPERMPAENAANMVTVPPIMQSRQPIPELYMSLLMQKIFLQHKLFVRLLLYNHNRKEKEMKDVPLIFHAIPAFFPGGGGMELPKPMHYYPKSAMQDIGNLNWTNRTKTITCTDSHLASTLVYLTSIYCLERDSAKKLLLGQQDFCYFYGSGSAARVAGEAGPNITEAFTVEDRPWGYCASPQETHSNQVNNCLSRAAENTQLLDLWMGAELVKELIGKEEGGMKLRPPKAQHVLHVGRAVCVGVQTVEGKTSMEDVLACFPGSSLEQKARSHPHLSFMLRSYKIFKVRLLEKDLMKGLSSTQDQKAEGWRLLTITNRDDEYASFRLPENDRNLRDHAGVGPTVPGGIVNRQLTYHFDEHIKPIMNDLPLLYNLPMIPETAARERADSRPWMLYRDNL